MDQMAAVYVSILLLSLLVFYDQYTKRIPTRLREDQRPKSGFGLVSATGNGFGNDLPARADGIDIIFVHGLGSNPDTTWRAERQAEGRDTATDPRSKSDQYVNWVSDFLPNDLSPINRQDARIFFYNYDSYWKRDAVHTRLSNIASGLLEHIKTRIRQSEEQSRNLIFVGYSYGGLVIKQALVEAYASKDLDRIAECTKAILFLGTPHRGSSFTLLGRMAAQALRPLGSNPSLLAEVEYDSIFLLDLHRRFTRAVPNELHVFNFFEERPTRILQLWFVQWREFCVREQSATYDGSRVRNIGLAVDHFGLNKFGSRNEIYQIIRSKLAEVMSPLVRTIRHYYAVPLETVGTYTQRRELSDLLQRKLEVKHENASVPYAVAIYGLGGTGKSQLALKYAEDHKDQYNPIVWIDGTDEKTMQSSFESCAAELKISVDRTESKGAAFAESKTVQAVLQWLRNRTEAHDKWLVIIDNADDVSWGIKKITPQGKRGSVIITSQDNSSFQLVDRGCEQLEVSVMSTLEANTLLLQRLQLDTESSPKVVQQNCNRIVQKLGCLALAVDLAGAYISREADKEAALIRYIADYDRHQDELLQDNYFRGLLPTEKTVWTVWDTTLSKLQRDHASLQPILLLAFLARFKGSIIEDEIFRKASLGFAAVTEMLGEEELELPGEFRQFLQLAGGEWDSFSYRKSRDILLRYSLVQRVGGEWPGVKMHSLVQWRAMQYEKSRSWEWWYLVFVLAACEGEALEEDRPHFRRHLVVHFPEVDDRSLNNAKVSEDHRIFIWFTIGSMLHYEGRWAQAEELVVQGMETSLRVCGPEHLDTLTIMNNLAATYLHQDRWKEAEELFVQVLETRKRVLGLEHLDTLTSMVNLASTYWNQGRWKEAEELVVQVLETRKRVLGVEHPFTLISIANLAMTYIDQGRLKEAEEILTQVTETSKRVLGVEHPDTLNSMANLAFTYWEQGRLKEAEELEVQVVETSKRVLGAEHPYTLKSMSRLALTWKFQGRRKQAISLLSECAELFERKFGADHPDTKTVLENLKDWQAEQDEAELLGTE